MKAVKEKKTKNLTEHAFSGFIWMMMGSAAQVVLKIGVLAVLARLVSPQVFGVMSIAIMVVDFSKMFTHMGVGPALVQRQELEERHLTSGFSLSLAMGVFFALTLVLTAPFIASFFKMHELVDVLRVIAFVFLIDSFTLIAQALMQRNMRFKTAVAFEVVSYALGYGAVGIFLAYQGWGIWAMVSASLAQALLFTVLLVWAQPFPKRLGFDTDAIKDLLFFGGGFTIAKIGNYFATQGDNLVVGKTLGAGPLGIYGRAYQFMVMPAGLFGNALDRALFPAMAKVQDDKARLNKAFLTGVGLIALIAIPISFMIVFLAKEIVMILLGPKWLDVVIPFQILGASLLFRMSYKMSESLARATGAVYRRAWRQFVYAALVLGGSYVGHFWGLEGVALGVAIALVINFFLMAHLSLQLTNGLWVDFLGVHQYGLRVGIIVGAVGYGSVTLCRYLFTSDFLVLMGSAIGTLIPLAVVMYFAPRLVISDEQRELLDTLFLKKIRKKITRNA